MLAVRPGACFLLLGIAGTAGSAAPGGGGPLDVNGSAEDLEWTLKNKLQKALTDGQNAEAEVRYNEQREVAALEKQKAAYQSIAAINREYHEALKRVSQSVLKEKDMAKRRADEVQSYSEAYNSKVRMGEQVMQDIEEAKKVRARAEAELEEKTAAVEKFRQQVLEQKDGHNAAVDEYHRQKKLVLKADRALEKFKRAEELGNHMKDLGLAAQRAAERKHKLLDEYNRQLTDDYVPADGGDAPLSDYAPLDKFEPPDDYVPPDDYAPPRRVYEHLRHAPMARPRPRHGDTPYHPHFGHRLHSDIVLNDDDTKYGDPDYVFYSDDH